MLLLLAVLLAPTITAASHYPDEAVEAAEAAVRRTLVRNAAQRTELHSSVPETRQDFQPNADSIY